MRKFKKADFDVNKIRRFLEPGPVVLVSSAHGGDRDVMTMGWHMILGDGPSLVGCYIWDRNHSRGLIARSRECVINVPTFDLIDAVTRSLAAELGPKKVRVNSVNPGMIETEGTHSAGITESDFRKQIEAQTPLGRIGRVDDVAPVVTFLASDDARWVTGQVLYVSGGNR